MTTMCYSGNLGLSHDLETIVHAVDSANGRAEFRMRFVGNGKAKQALYDLTSSLGLMNLGFYPPVPLHKLPDFLSEVDVHFVAQKPETEGLVVPSKIYGIMAVGRPTIFIGPQDSEVATIISKSESGIVVAPGDVESTADAIVELTLNSELRIQMGENAKKYTQRWLSQDTSVAQIIKAVEKTVGS